MNALRALNACSLDGTHMMEQLDLGYGGSKNVVTLGMRCCDLLWVDSARGSRRALRTRSPRILCRCPALRRQILGVCRRGMGAESRGHRGRNRSCQALPQGRPCPNRAGRVDGAVMRLTAPRPDDAKPHGRLSRALRKRGLSPGQRALGLIWRAAGAYSEDGDNCPMQLRRRVQAY